MSATHFLLGAILGKITFWQIGRDGKTMMAVGCSRFSPLNPTIDLSRESFLW